MTEPKKELPVKIATIRDIKEIIFEEIELFDGTKFILLPPRYESRSILLMGKDRYIIQKTNE